MKRLGYFSLIVFIFLIGFCLAITLSYVSPPTPSDEGGTNNASVEIQVNLTSASDLEEFVWNWNGTNYTLYDNNLVAMLNFDNISDIGESNGIVKDVSIYDLEIMVNNTAPKPVTSGKFFSGYEFNNSGFFSIDYKSEVRTLSFWLKTYDRYANLEDYSDSKNGYLFSQRYYLDEEDGEWCMDWFASPKLRIYAYGVSSNNEIKTSADIPLDTWIHVVLTSNGTHVEWYLDGEFDSTHEHDAVLGGADNDDNLFIGGGGANDEVFSFNGTLDEVRVWNRTLSSEEIEILYMSNLRKFDSDKWSFYINQSKNPSTQLDEGNYTYEALSRDSLNNWDSSGENNIIVDRTNPVIDDFFISSTLFCGDGYVRLNCSVTEDYIDSIYFDIDSPGNSFNPEGIFDGNNYYFDFHVNETGDYSSRCVVEDKGFNTVYSSYENFSRMEDKPDLAVGEINFSEENPIEDEEYNVTIFVENLGCAASGSFDVGFYNGSLIMSNLLSTESTSINEFSGDYITFYFNSTLGETNYSFFADYDDSIDESDENNNVNSSVLTVSAWQTFYGDIVVARRLIDESSNQVMDWGNMSGFSGNVFVADSECNINWAQLYPLGKNNQSLDSSNDFSELDSVLGMDGYEDNISYEYSSPLELSYFVSQRNITNVKSVESLTGNPFYTGILWDNSDDVGDGEFDSTDQEDVVFVSEAYEGSACNSGACDFEIQIPVKIREYKTSQDSTTIYFYQELV